jgi:hypothetical protein
MRALLPFAAAAALVMNSCDPAESTDSSSKAADRQSKEALESATPTLEATLDGHAWVAASIHYHVDQAFDAKEYAHTLEARAADGSRLDMIILCGELTLSPRDYPSSQAEEVTVTYTPAGRSAGSFAGDAVHDAQVKITSERTAASIQGAFSATLQDLDPNGRALRLQGTFGAIPRARP